ncbi:MAG: IS200/IS605 family transposase [Coriobacteriales bacterium]|nr:IS200/IS605 family transposase [Coriobacteriales bacterium]
MNNNQSLAHTRWDCTYHIVFIPKYRRKVLYGEARREIRDVLRRLVDAKDGVELVEGSVCRDHIHMCLRIAPKHAVSKVMGYLKGKSALIMFDHHPEWRRLTGRDRTLWARGYFVSTVGLNEATIRKYVRNQEDASRIAE